LPLQASGASHPDRTDRSLWLQPLSANICIGRKRVRHRATINQLSLQAILAVDRPTMEQSTSGFEGILLALSPGHNFSATSDLVASGTALGGYKYFVVGNGGRVANNVAGANGMAGLQALAK
jgi:hypothetical protein